jgi:hypothetical protein
MNMKWAVALVLATGCQTVFNLEHVDPTMACWDPEHVTHDEDADGVVDGCDVCPNIADAEQADADADGVGDACDPDRDDPHHRLAFFDPFTADVLDPLWVTYGTNAQWTIADDALSQLGTSGVNPLAMLALHETFMNPTVIAGLTGQGQLDPALSSSHGIYTRIDPAAEMAFPEALLCFSLLFANTTPQRRALVVENEPTQIPKADEPLKGGEPLVLRAASDGICMGRVADNPNVTAAVDLGPLDGEIALMTRNTVGTFHSILVIETAP